jgi:hypothetical protein
MVIAVEVYRNLRPLQIGRLRDVGVEDFSLDELPMLPQGSYRRSPKDHVHRTVFTWVRAPAPSSLSGGGPPFLGWSAVLGLRVPLM